MPVHEGMNGRDSGAGGGENEDVQELDVDAVGWWQDEDKDEEERDEESGRVDEAGDARQRGWGVQEREGSGNGDARDVHSVNPDNGWRLRLEAHSSKEVHILLGTFCLSCDASFSRSDWYLET